MLFQGTLDKVKKNEKIIKKFLRNAVKDTIIHHRDLYYGEYKYTKFIEFVKGVNHHFKNFYQSLIAACSSEELLDNFFKTCNSECSKELTNKIYNPIFKGSYKRRAKTNASNKWIEKKIDEMASELYDKILLITEEIFNLQEQNLLSQSLLDEKIFDFHCLSKEIVYSDLTSLKIERECFDDCVAYPYLPNNETVVTCPGISQKTYNQTVRVGNLAADEEIAVKMDSYGFSIGVLVISVLGIGCLMALIKRLCFRSSH